jgi:hypothetical protein
MQKILADNLLGSDVESDSEYSYEIVEEIVYVTDSEEEGEEPGPDDKEDQGTQPSIHLLLC